MTTREAGTAFTLTALTNGSALGVGLGGRLAQVPAGSAARFTAIATTGCAQFPEIEVNATGTPFTGTSATGRVRGFLDDHIHIGAFEFLGGRFHWRPAVEPLRRDGGAA